MPMPKGPTSEVGLKPPHRAGLVVASSCKVVVGMGVGIVAVGSCGCDVAMGMVDSGVFCGVGCC